MSALRLLPILSLLLLVLSAASPPAAPTVYVMRHLEKGTGDDPPLSPQGAANARRLVRWFAANKPAAIYSSTARRARETAAPIAAALRLPVKPYDPRDSKALAALVAKETGTVLVVGHSNTVPEIVALLGGTRPEPIPEGRFGDIFRISGAGRSVEKLHIDSPAPRAAKKRQRR